MIKGADRVGLSLLFLAMALVTALALLEVRRAGRRPPEQSQVSRGPGRTSGITRAREELATGTSTDTGRLPVHAGELGEVPMKADYTNSDQNPVPVDTRIELLLTAQARMEQAKERLGTEVSAQWELTLLQRCVGAMLDQQGRAHYPDAVDLKRGGFSARPGAEGDQVMMQDGALYQFARGEFPAYDNAWDRVLGEVPTPRTPEFDDQVELAITQALAVLASMDSNKKEH